MKALHQQTLNEQSLMPRDWLRRRMTRFVHKGEHAAFRPTITLNDLAKWFGVGYTLMLHMENGRIDISDRWQVQLSQFFYLLDMGLIELRVGTKPKVKTWVRTAPSVAPCKEPKPRVDFLATKLRFD
jgi:hypothetical protein